MSESRLKYLAISNLRQHRGVLIRVISDEDGKWFATCPHPSDDAVLETEEFNTPESAIAELK